MEVLSIDPGFPVEVEEEHAVLQSPGPIMRQRQLVHPRPRRTFKLPYGLLSKAEKDQLVALFHAVRGRAGRFLFTPIDEADPLECQFTEDSLAWSIDTPVRRSLTLTFKEAL